MRLLLALMLPVIALGCAPATGPRLAPTTLPDHATTLSAASERWKTRRTPEDFRILSSRIDAEANGEDVKRLLGEPLKVESHIWNGYEVWVCYRDKRQVCAVQVDHLRLAGGTRPYVHQIEPEPNEED